LDIDIYLIDDNYLPTNTHTHLRRGEKMDDCYQ